MMVLLVGLSQSYITLGSTYSSKLTLVSSGGVPISSATYSSDASVSQAAIGDTESSNYKTHVGFWSGAEAYHKPTIDLLTPTNGNDSIHDLFTEFTWDGKDLDNDPLEYTIWVSNSSDLTSPVLKNITEDENITSSTELKVDMTYFWRVEVYDGTYRINSSIWNFTIESYQAIEMTVNATDFGEMFSCGAHCDMVNESIINWTKTNSTEDNNPMPLVVRNIGNIPLNLTIYANDTLFTHPDSLLNTSHFRFKVDNRTEPGSFNRLLSQTSWTNMTSYNVSLLYELNNSKENDEADIDLFLNVSSQEPWGKKDSTLVIQVP